MSRRSVSTLFASSAGSFLVCRGIWTGSFEWLGCYSRNFARPSPSQIWFPPIQAAPVKPSGQSRQGASPRRQFPTRATSPSTFRHASYPSSDQDLVDQYHCRSALPPKMWFTYQISASVRGLASDSRAAGQEEGGLVPGIRFEGNSVVEDGPVRRFDRSQLTVASAIGPFAKPIENPKIRETQSVSHSASFMPHSSAGHLWVGVWVEMETA